MAITSTEIDKVVELLSGLRERELVEILSRVFDNFSQKFAASDDFGDRYALVRSSFEKGEDKEPYIHFLGLPSEMYWQQSNDEALDYGRCPTCSVTVACVNKLATCPVCGTTGVQCT